MEFFTWPMLATHGGAFTATLLLTEITKELPYIKKLPTQFWSYVIAAVVLMLANIFGGSFSIGNAMISLLNAAIVALSANGGYSLLSDLGVVSKKVSKDDDHDAA